MIEDYSDTDSNISVNVIDKPMDDNKKWAQVTNMLKVTKKKKPEVTVDKPMPEEKAFL